LENASLRGFENLLNVMKRLRSPEGCPWDREQTKYTLKWYLIEECYEVLDAIDLDSAKKLKEELGDTLFQIIFLAELSEEKGDFDIFDVINSAREKMIRRHPHVFSDKIVKDSREVKKIWWKIKEEEKGEEEGSIFDSIPQPLPSLLRAFRVTKRAANVGFDWGSLEGALDKLEEEIGEFKETLRYKNSDRVEDELGDILFSLVNLCRFLEINPEEALRKTITKFTARFKKMERLLKKEGKKIGDATPEEMDKLWDNAKRRDNPLQG